MDQTPSSDYEFDGARISRGSLRLGFRTLVPHEIKLDEPSAEMGLFVANEFGVFNRLEYPQVINWTIQASVLLNTSDPFSNEELPLDVIITENFTPAGRMKFRVKTRPQDIELLRGKAVELVFRVANNDVPVAPIIPSHPIRFVHEPSEVNEEEIEPDFLSCKRLVIASFAGNGSSKPMRFLVGEAASSLGIGGKVWDGSLAMLEFLFETEDRWEALGFPNRSNKLKILDLGSGTGILGHGLALLLPESTIVNTDLPEVVPLLKMNGQGVKNLISTAYSWGDPLPEELAELEPFDIIFMCDVVYDQDCYEPLLRSLQRLRTKHVLMCHRHRNRSEVEFFTKIALAIGKLECVKYPIIKDDDPFHTILKLAKPAEKVFDSKFKATMNDVAIFRITIKQHCDES